MENINNSNLPVDRLYKSREDFSIIGLTGMAGCGCSSLANMMSSRSFLEKVRNPKDIKPKVLPKDFDDNEYAIQNDMQSSVDESVSSLVFKQKYTICYEFANVNYKEYKVLKYTHILWLYVLLCAKKKDNSCNMKKIKTKLVKLLSDKYRPQRDENEDKTYKKIIKYDCDSYKEFIKQILDGFQQWAGLCKKLKDLESCYVDNFDESKNQASTLYNFAESSEFKEFVTYLINKLSEKDYYSLCFLHHRLAAQIRMIGEPFSEFRPILNKYKNKQESRFLYNIVILINILIKGYKKEEGENGCRIAIDSLRNSLEARYFKERYTAFYLICVNDSEERESRLRSTIKEKMPLTKKNKKLLQEVYTHIKRLTDDESNNDEFSCGVFASPDVENVIADAEIHINNSVDKVKKDLSSIYEFCTMEEQWMKYSSLILHPGLITPSAEERCMVVAYTAKFNSSCLSRQVGAVITNQYHSIRTIGWNDVPFGQMPCGLRELHMISNDCTDCNHIYSNFEIGSHKYYQGKSFKDKLYDYRSGLKPNKDTRNSIKPSCIEGLPYSYCFKELHNIFEGEKNQVFTRSLHAEENAILQMAKYGGEPLMNGVIYVTASPCELCAKKLYQIGVRKIVYIDPYPGISMDQIIRAGFKRPHLKLFQGAYGASYFKLYQPFMSYKDELNIRLNKSEVVTGKYLLSKILDELGEENRPSYTKTQAKSILKKLKKD